MTTVMEKEEAHKLVDRLPNSATWDDLMHEIYVREAIERGLADSRAGRTTDVRDVRAKYGPSCLILGFTVTGRPLHVQSSYPSRPLIKVVTVYEPDPELWTDFRIRKTD